MMRRLARFRADPSRVRVSIRRSGDDGWEVYVAARDGSGDAWSCGHTPEMALDKALSVADSKRIPGVDLHMEWAYEHPWPATL